MKKFQLAKMEENSNLNRGELFEKIVKLSVDPNYVYHRDSTPFWVGSDIEELEASVKLVNDCTLCKSPEKLEEAVNYFLTRDVSKIYLLGFDMIDESNYHILELDKLEMRDFLGEYGSLSKASAEKNHATILKIRLRSKKAQEKAWKKMGGMDMFNRIEQVFGEIVESLDKPFYEILEELDYIGMIAEKLNMKKAELKKDKDFKRWEIMANDEI